VEHAKYCIKEYPTIVNNIPKEKNVYTSSMADFAKIDNRLSHSQRAIGESSNLAQVCLSYGHTFKDQKYRDNACILAVIAQAAIDSAKRSFEIDIPSEIKRIRTEIDVDNIGYPAFWTAIRDGFKHERINYDIECPMNKLYRLKVPRVDYADSTIPTLEFINDFEHDGVKVNHVSKKIADLITKYAIDLYEFRTGISDDTKETHLLLRSDFDDIMNQITRDGLSKKYLPIMSWLINRGFKNAENTYNLKKNRSLLLGVLYKANKECLLKIFDKTCKKKSNRMQKSQTE